MRTIPESDWKKLRAIRERALNRFCAGVLRELRSEVEAADLASNAHQAYLDVYKLVGNRDEELGALFDDWRRSTVFGTLMGWARSGVLSEEEFESLSDDTKSVVRSICDVVFYVD